VKVGLATLVSVVLLAASASAAEVPNNAVTPGALNPAVTQDNIDTTICRFGWSKTVRPPFQYTERLKRKLLYTPTSPYYDPGVRLRDYELDHRVPIGVGGSPTDRRNLTRSPRQRAREARMEP
jgi:opacity protein-like surface antigen